MVKLLLTFVAALKSLFPLCEATMVHVPVATMVMFNPDVVHTLVVEDAIETV